MDFGMQTSTEPENMHLPPSALRPSLKPGKKVTLFSDGHDRKPSIERSLKVAPGKKVTLFSDGHDRKPSIERLPKVPRPLHQDTMFNMDLELHEPNKANRISNIPLESNRARNVVIFGDSGVGKSSLINMLAGHKTAATSNGVLGCTFESRSYSIAINGEKVNVWDTAGLDEGTLGRVPQQVAEQNLTKLLRELRGANGIHLLVYCIRGPSVRRSLARNYAIFYSAICRKKVPIVAVVTGLENESSSMDDWWARGGKELSRYKMRFDAHACVTTIDVGKAVGSVFEQRSRESQDLVRRLIIDYCHLVATRPSDANLFIKAALHDFRAMMRSGWENVQLISTVIFYQSDITFFPSVFGDLRQISCQINGRTFVFQHAGDLSERYITTRISKGGADLLIFAGKAPDDNMERLRQFYTSCLGEVCPLLVITQDVFVSAWTQRLDDLGIGGRVQALPPDGHQADFSNLIDELCLVRAAAKYRKRSLLRFFRRKSKESGVDDISAPLDMVLVEAPRR